MVSVMNTGTCLRPSWTAMVWPTMSGKMSLRRDQVLMTFFSRVALRICTFLSRCSSQNGPFLVERLMTNLLLPPPHDHPVGLLVVTGAVPEGGLAPGRLGVAAGTTATLAAAVGMVEGVHAHPPDRGTEATPAHLAGLAPVLILVVDVADLADGGHAAHVDTAHLPAGHADRRHPPLAGEQLAAGPGAAHHLAAAAEVQLDVVDGG